MKLSKTLKLTLAAVAAVALISSVQAAEFTISTAHNSTTIGIPPTSASAVIFAGPGIAGGTRFDVTSLGATIDNSPGHTTLDLTGSITTTGAGTIELCLTADGFSPVTPISFGFVANSSMNPHAITLSDTLMINGMSQQASTNGLTLAAAPHGISQGMSNTVTITPNSSPFSLENCITITFGAGGGTVSFDKITGGGGVPDSGMTVSMLGLGLLAIAGAAKLRRVKATA